MLDFFNKNLAKTCIGIVIFLSGFSQTLKAQGLGNSPYSVLGMGEPMGESFSANLSTGQAGVSSGSVFYINNLNPALWARNRITMFEFGVMGQYKQISQPGASQKDFGANLAFAALAFPIRSNWTTGLSLKPFSYMDYNNRSSSSIPGTIYTANHNLLGKGAVNKVTFTNGVQVNKYINLGLDVSYFFGNIRKAAESFVQIGDRYDLLTSTNERISYHDFTFRAGAAGHVPLKPKSELSLNWGATYNFGTNLKARQTSTIEYTDLNGNEIGVPPDTLANNANGGITSPPILRVGASLEWLYKLTLSIDHEWQQWSQYRNFDNINEGLINVGRTYVGAEYIPRFTATEYFSRVAYRAGINFGKSPFTPNGLNINETNVSFGLGLPLGARGSVNTFNIGFIAGQRGVLAEGAIREKYIRGVISVSLGELWFEKPRID